MASAARILAFSSMTFAGGLFSSSWLKPGRPSISAISSVAPAGTKPCAAFSAMRLNEPLRRLPAMPRILMLAMLFSESGRRQRREAYEAYIDKATQQRMPLAKHRGQVRWIVVGEAENLRIARQQGQIPDAGSRDEIAITGIVMVAVSRNASGL